MAEIRLRFGMRDIRIVSVRDPHCPTLRCFFADRHTIRSPAGASGCSSRTTDEWECGTRDRQGCPSQTRADIPPRFRKARGVWTKEKT